MDPLISWQHFEVIGIVFVPLILYALASARRNAIVRREQAAAIEEYHRENRERLIKIETLLEMQVAPLYRWWISKIGNGGKHE